MVGEHITRALSDENGNLDCTEVVLWRLLLIVNLHVFFGTVVESLESLCLDDLSVMDKLLPTCSGWLMHVMYWKPIKVLGLALVVEVALFKVEA